jgi:type I restriction enzyme S subunit
MGYIDSISTKTAVPYLNKDNCNSIQIPFPTLTEQEAIAGALSDADVWIESLEQLIAKKRQIKQGAMQELLTGKRRLPGFSGKWETKQISDIAVVGRGRVISHVEISRSRDPKYPVFSSQTFNDGVMGYIDTFDFDGDYITRTTDGANAGTVFARSGRFNCTNVCGTIKVQFGNHRFIAVALGRVAKSHVSRHLGNPKLMNDVLKRIAITIPSNYYEQNSVATVLSDMDTEIESLESKLAKAREIKQGMMQELLTGKIRLVKSSAVSANQQEMSHVR